MTTSQCSPPFASPSPASLSPAPYPSYSSLSPSPSPASLSSSMRLWRPAAQRNLRNQWSKLSSCRQQWVIACSGGRSHATSLVNSHLSQIYMPMMELGVLSDMADIKKKALEKLFNQQSAYRRKLLSSYKDLKIQVAVVVEMVNASRSLRSYIKSSNGSLIQFSNSTDNASDTGDCGGIPVYSFWSISAFEKIAEEFVEMFKCEIMLKRLLVLELVALSSEVPQPVKLSWSAELYNGEFDDLTKCSLYTIETSAPIFSRVREQKPGNNPSQTHTKQPTSVNLQVYLTTWLAEVNINIHRVDEILALIGEEMRVAF